MSTAGNPFEARQIVVQSHFFPLTLEGCALHIQRPVTRDIAAEILGEKSARGIPQPRARHPRSPVASVMNLDWNVRGEHWIQGHPGL